jgi:hypothetical protein
MTIERKKIPAQHSDKYMPVLWDSYPKVFQPKGPHQLLQAVQHEAH